MTLDPVIPWRLDESDILALEMGAGILGPAAAEIRTL